EPVAPQPRPLQVLTDDDMLAPPEYPASALEEGLEGKVVLEVFVGVDGAPKEVRVKESTPAGVFDEVAVAAAWRWQFNAGRKGNGGEKVEGWVVVPVQFAKKAPADA